MTRRALPPGLVWHAVGALLVLVALLCGTLFAPLGGGSPVHELAQFAGRRFNDGFLTLGILTLLLLAWRGRSRAEFIRLLAVMLTVTLVVQIIQKGSFYGLGMWPRPSGRDGGFPSGHAAASCALAFLLTERLPWGAPLWYAAAALITWSRVETTAHYPYQIACGAVLGFGVAYSLTRRQGPRTPHEDAARTTS